MNCQLLWYRTYVGALELSGKSQVATKEAKT